MNRQSIGKLVRYEREKKQISIQNLANGICSISTLQRVENGERLPDFFVLERMIERLGKSINKMEFLYHQGDYEIYYLREVIERYLENKQYADVWEGLEAYEALKEAEEPIHKQYIFKMYGAIASEVEKNHQKAAMYLEEALQLTVPDFQIEKIGDYLLGEGEFVILLMWIQEKYQLGNDLSLLEMDSVLFSIEKICEDEEIRANIYCKAALVLGEILIGQGNHEKALELYTKGKDILVENGTLVHLPQIIERILNLSKNQNAALYNELKKQRDALKDLYEEYGEPWTTEMSGLWKNYSQMEVYLVSELFEESRKMKGYTQEQLAEKLKIDPKTLSRIENGRFKPKDGTF
ncbi:MAG: helix-turn-helix domain-containing protein, partial [Lachnospiraceae bacterium]|nr:helix-turn-helix domain-containing protein [Lachnospiraceae bacterium]